MTQDRLDQLVWLANRLAEPSREWAILGEGNVSTQADQDSIWVTASGAELRTAKHQHFVKVASDPILAMLEGGPLTDEQIKAQLLGARVDADGDVRPSTETLMHATCLQIEGVEFVGHVHPVAVNSILCSKMCEDALGGRLFPDEIVVCGPKPVLVPYVDPGVPLARAIKTAVDAATQARGAPPKVVYLQNHGIVALGTSARDVENILLMADKAARILVGTHALGGPRFLTDEAVARIDGRPDEHYRQRVINRTGLS